MRKLWFCFLFLVSPAHAFGNYSCEITVESSHYPPNSCKNVWFLAQVSGDLKSPIFNTTPCENRLTLSLVEAKEGYQSSLRLWDLSHKEVMGESTFQGEGMLPWFFSNQLTTKDDFNRPERIFVRCKK